jgi:hypothetical protein
MFVKFDGQTEQRLSRYAVAISSLRSSKGVIQNFRRFRSILISKGCLQTHMS